MNRFTLAAQGLGKADRALLQTTLELADGLELAHWDLIMADEAAVLLSGPKAAAEARAGQIHLSCNPEHLNALQLPYPISYGSLVHSLKQAQQQLLRASTVTATTPHQTAIRQPVTEPTTAELATATASITADPFGIDRVVKAPLAEELVVKEPVAEQPVAEQPVAEHPETAAIAADVQPDRSTDSVTEQRSLPEHDPVELPTLETASLATTTLTGSLSLPPEQAAGSPLSIDSGLTTAQINPDATRPRATTEQAVFTRIDSHPLVALNDTLTDADIPLLQSVVAVAGGVPALRSTHPQPLALPPDTAQTAHTDLPVVDPDASTLAGLQRQLRAMRPAKRFFPVTRIAGLISNAVSQYPACEIRHPDYPTLQLFRGSGRCAAAEVLLQQPDYFQQPSSSFSVHGLSRQEPDPGLAWHDHISNLRFHAIYHGSQGRLIGNLEADDLLTLDPRLDLSSAELPDSLHRLLNYLRLHQQTLAEITLGSGYPLDQVVAFCNACKAQGWFDSHSAGTSERHSDAPAPPRAGLLTRVRKALHIS